MKLEWSADALADLNRFAVFLHEDHPALAARIAGEIIKRAEILEDQPQLGRPLSLRPEYRQLALRVLNGMYLFQYRYDGERLMMLRVLHRREARA